MKTLYAISTGGCRDGFYLDYVIEDLTKVNELAKIYFDKELKGYGDKEEFVNSHLNFEEGTLTIEYKNTYYKETHYKEVEFNELGVLL